MNPSLTSSDQPPCCSVALARRNYICTPAPDRPQANSSYRQTIKVRQNKGCHKQSMDFVKENTSFRENFKTAKFRSESLGCNFKVNL